MSNATHEHTKCYELDTVGTVVAYGKNCKISIKLIVLQFKNDGDRIKLTDAISGSAGESADDTIVDCVATYDWETIVIPFNPPMHAYGLKVATFSNADGAAFVYLA